MALFLGESLNVRYARLIITRVVIDPFSPSSSNFPLRPNVIKENSEKLMLQHTLVICMQDISK